MFEKKIDVLSLNSRRPSFAPSIANLIRFRGLGRTEAQWCALHSSWSSLVWRCSTECQCHQCIWIPDHPSHRSPVQSINSTSKFRNHYLYDGQVLMSRCRKVVKFFLMVPYTPVICATRSKPPAVLKFTRPNLLVPMFSIW